jgi:hypothetical protein
MITIEESFGIIQKLLVSGFETKIGISHPRGFSGRSGSGGAHLSFHAHRLRFAFLEASHLPCASYYL